MNARSAYREAEVSGATPVRLVVLLYEQLIEDLRQAVRAMEQGQVEARTRRLNHALDVIARLQVTLDHDQGGEVARRLAEFYEQVRCNLWKAQLTVSRQLLLQQILDLLELREAWIEVERTESEGRLSPPVPGGAARDAGSEQPTPSSWKA